MIRLSGITALLVVLAFIATAGGVTPSRQEDEGSSNGGFITIGYGKLSIEGPIYMEGEEASSPAADRKWGMILLGGGYYLFHGKTQFEIDLYATAAKHEKTTTGDLIGGGTYTNERSVRNWCLMLRMRQCIVNPVFISAGIGMFEEATENSNNTITGGNSWSHDYGAFSYGIDIRINRYLLLGIQRISVAKSDLFGEYSDEVRPPRTATLGELVFLISM